MEDAPREIDGFKIPEWWECSWRRKRCEKRSCRFCCMMWANEAKVSNKNSLFLGDFGSELSSEESENDALDFEGISESKLAELEENEPPRPEHFSLYTRVKTWSSLLTGYFYSNERQKNDWVKTEATEDLLWYSTLLPSKLYRQLTTRWETAQNKDDEYEQEFGRLETAYTGYVIRQCCEIIESSLAELSRPENHPPLKTALSEFKRLKTSIIAIAPQ